MSDLFCRDEFAHSGREVWGVRQTPLGTVAQIVMGGLLTAVAGFVDAVGYISLGGLFASFMSGASVSLGVGLGDGDWDPVHQGLLMIASFLGGVTAATVLAGQAGAWRLPLVLLLEALLLAAAVLLAGSGWTISVAILPVVAAMGVQNTALKPMGEVRLGATFITGTLVSLGETLGQAMLGRPQPRHLAGHTLLWGALAAGAVAGAILHTEFGAIALLVPAVLVTGLTMLTALAVIANEPRKTGIRRTSSSWPVRQRADLRQGHPSVWPYY